MRERGHGVRRALLAIAWALTVGALLMSVLLAAPAKTHGAVRVALSAALVVSMLGSLVVGGLVLSRRPGNSIGLILVAMAPFWAMQLASSAVVTHYVATRDPIPGQDVFVWIECWVGFPPFNALLPILLLVYPSGRLLSRRWRWVVALLLVGAVAGTIGGAFAPGPTADESRVVNPYGVDGWFGTLCVHLRDSFAWLVFLVAALLAAASVILRFRRSSGIERAQLKWLAYAGSLFGLVFPAWYWRPEDLGPFTTLLVVAAVPVAVGIAVLRYRLYDIDRLISRTITYALLTATIAGLFVLIVTAVSDLTSGTSQLGVAGATLVSAAAVNPLRRRLQRLVDRRFNRAPIDAARTVETFARALTNEVELPAITDRLLGTVADSVEPVSATLWLASGRP